MKVTYVGPFGGGETIDETGQHVGHGETVEVPDEIGEGLLRSSSWAGTGSARRTVDDVLAEVGDDPAAAAAALEVERAHPSPRSTLIAKLETIAASGEED